MKNIYFYKLLCCSLFLLFSNMVFGQLTLIGPDTVCEGATAEYTVSPASPTDVYTWFATGGMGTGSSTSTEKITFTAVSPPLANVTVINTTNPGYGFKSVHVLPRPSLSLTSNFEVGCRSLATDTTQTGESGENSQDMLDDDLCIKVCEKSIIRYYAGGMEGTFDWVVTGADLLQDWGDSIEVQWGMAGTSGFIKLSTTTLCGYFEKTICAEVVENPGASFSVKPVSGPAQDFEACVNTDIIFRDLSKGSKESPIVSWYWDFGDGTVSHQQNPIHAYTSSGSYVITLMVRNACNCVDSFKVNVTVNSVEGPPIDCPSVVCENQKVTYTTSATCNNYTWTVSGGTIVSGGTASDDFVEVDWTGITDDFGYVSLATPSCSNVCAGTTVIKVPVIRSNAVIAGPDDLCTGQQYEFSLPLWPGTRWNWGVIGNPSTVLGIRNDHKMVVQFDAPGTYELHATYQNTVAHCGGDTVRVITVKANTVIEGDNFACLGQSKTYTLNPSATANWTLQTPSGSVQTSGSSFTANFMETGDYVLKAEGDFCISPLSISVYEYPPDIDVLSGEDQVCLNTPYTYVAGDEIPGYVFNWDITGGYILASNNEKERTVVWTSSSGQLKVWREHAGGAPCLGAVLTLDVMEDLINPVISGPDPACANSYNLYSANYTSGDNYFWRVSPKSAGSVAEGVYDPDAKIIWNHVLTTTSAVVTVEVSKCGVKKIVHYNVTLNPSPLPVFVTAPATACPGKVTFEVTGGAATYVWDIPGVFQGAGTNPLTVKFPHNKGATAQNYTVSVTASGVASGADCPPLGTATTSISITPGPVAFASSPGPLNICGTVAVLEGDYENGGSSPSFSWLKDDAFFDDPSPSTNSSTSTAGTYRFAVYDANGCADTSGTIEITSNGCGGSGCTNPPQSPTLTSTVNCQTVTLLPSFNPGANSYSWQYSSPPATGANTTTLYFDKAGRYTITYKEIWPSPYCNAEISEQVTIGAAAEFFYTIHCGAGNTYDVVLDDRSSSLDGWKITQVDWEITPTISATPSSGTGSSFSTNLAAGQTYIVAQTIKGTDSIGAPFSCTVEREIIIPEKPEVTALITSGSSSLCEELPISFEAQVNPAATVVAKYMWDFDLGNGFSAIPAPQSSFPRSPIFQQYIINLEITDAYGCTATDQTQVIIYPNDLDGYIQGAGSVCSGTQLTLDYLSLSGNPTDYIWKRDILSIPGLTQYDVTQSGAYWIQVEDANQCRFNADPVTVLIIPTPKASISGNNNYCAGENVLLNGFSGSDFSYEWKRDGSVISTNSVVNDPGLSPGTYMYQLTVTNNDPTSGLSCSALAFQPVTIRSAPSAPTISDPVIIDCSTYEIKLTGTHSSPGIFNWSNGSHGPENTIYEGGPYRLWFTNGEGCRSAADIFIPNSTEKSLAYIPTGCYSMCTYEASNIRIYGPPGVAFKQWEWQKNTTPDQSGVNNFVPPYTIPGLGTYNLTLDNGLCANSSKDLSLTAANCSGTCGIDYYNLSGACNPAIPGRYEFEIDLDNLSGVPATYVLSTSDGPVFPSSGYIAGYGSVSLKIQFNLFPELITPTVTDIQILFMHEDGSRCADYLTISGLGCGYPSQRPAFSDTADNSDLSFVQKTERPKDQLKIISSLSLYPNPSSNQATIAYDFGKQYAGSGYLSIFDVTGKKIADYSVTDRQGKWEVATGALASGVYLIRMEAEGKLLHSRRLVVAH